MVVQAPSIKSLQIRTYYNDVSLMNATGFLTQKGDEVYLITNRHVVRGVHNTDNTIFNRSGFVPNKLKIFHNARIYDLTPVNHKLADEMGIGHVGEWIEKDENLYDGANDPNNDCPIWFEHPTLKGNADFIALKLTELSGVAIYSYSLEKLPGDRFRVPEQVSVVGFPYGRAVGGHYAIWATGYIASEPDLDATITPQVYIDCRARSGQSGSPVIRHLPYDSENATGPGHPIVLDNSDLLGVYSGRISAESDIGMVWKKSAVKVLIDSI